MQAGERLRDGTGTAAKLQRRVVVGARWGSESEVQLGDDMLGSA